MLNKLFWKRGQLKDNRDLSRKRVATNRGSTVKRRDGNERSNNLNVWYLCLTHIHSFTMRFDFFRHSLSGNCRTWVKSFANYSCAHNFRIFSAAIYFSGIPPSAEENFAKPAGPLRVGFASSVQLCDPARLVLTSSSVEERPLLLSLLFRSSRFDNLSFQAFLIHLHSSPSAS